MSEKLTAKMFGITTVNFTFVQTTSCDESKSGLAQKSSLSSKQTRCKEYFWKLNDVVGVETKRKTMTSLMPFNDVGWKLKNDIVVYEIQFADVSNLWKITCQSW